MKRKSENLDVSTKSKKVKLDSDEFEKRLPFLQPFAQPLAGKKLTKRLFKLMDRASEMKLLRRGVKEVVKSLRKGEKGICVLAGDVTPFDVISHIPVFCEENEVLYCYVIDKASLGLASKTKRPTSVVFIPEGVKQSAEKEYKKCEKEIISLVPVKTT
ncbi:H/ACA ribonucleoprotein complex subunit 2 [Galdieria sulphuraria]|uniref:H/ACA ribonucleoprotein complex subunit 2 n=1 Tax=Galdieria sulphuraria TaxID=130081 RepID=M2Y6K3_GALSU|nr:H/ACA ribonucleoprotein complex subunit 2 [Galdieria sulphuraria]EME31663.1 H/ACA ribonucleoprotein complex subunit 2 [Galdieria sulphuraria]|eukprot:XP_005708183.1 H/ACA ribonucleoprotein complex subunit 2 [Galdieria sulphuraria]